MKNQSVLNSTLIFATGLFVGIGIMSLYKPDKDLLSQSSEQVKGSIESPNSHKNTNSQVNSGQETEKTPSMAENPIYSQDEVVLGKPEDWRSAYQAMLTPQDQERFMINLIESNMRQSPNEVFDFLKSLDSNALRNAAIAHALTIYAESSPINAIEQANQLLQGNENNNAIVDIAHVWGGNNPGEAVAWAGQQVNSKLGFKVLENVVSAAAQANPNQMQSLLQNSQLNVEQNKLAAKALAGVWAQTAPQEAVQWAKQYAIKSGDNSALTSAYLNWATADPASAVVALNGEQNSYSSTLMPEIADIWSQQNPRSAAEWATNIESSETRTKAIGNVAQIWTDSDPGAALKWASSLPGNDKEAALQSVALCWSSQDSQVFNQKISTLPNNLRLEIQDLLKKNQAPKR